MALPVVIPFRRAVAPPETPPASDQSCPPLATSSLAVGKDSAKEYLQQSVKISTRNQVFRLHCFLIVS